MALPSHQPDEEETPGTQDSLDHDSSPLISQASLHHSPTPPATSSTLFTSTSSPKNTSESNRNYSQHEELSYPLPSVVIVHRAVTVAGPTFGGPCFLNNTTWSRYHRIEMNGDIENKAGPDLKVLYPNENHEQFLQVLKLSVPTSISADF